MEYTTSIVKVHKQPSTNIQDSTVQRLQQNYENQSVCGRGDQTLIVRIRMTLQSVLL